MSDRFEWTTAGSAGVRLATYDELCEMADEPGDLDTGGLVLTGGSQSGFIIEGDDDELFEFLSNVMVLLDTQRKGALEKEAGRPVGMHVRVGKGKKVWQIDSYTRMGPSIVAALRPLPGDGYTGTSVTVDRLVDVT